MPARLLSVLSASQQDGMAITWAIQGNSSVYLPDNVSVPTFPYLPSIIGASTTFNEWILKPTEIQPATNFGAAKALSITINRYKQFYVNSTEEYIPGRVFVRITGSGQIYTFGAKETYSTAVVSNSITESTNTMIPIWSLNTSTVEVWLEPDSVNNVNTSPVSIVYATMFNFDITACGNIA